MMGIYDDTGFLEQTIFVGDFEKLQLLYEAAGKKVIQADQIDDKAYVANGVLTPRPEVAVTGAVRQIKADGLDSLHFDVAPGSFTLSLTLVGTVIQTESVTDGALDFSVTEPGSYTLLFNATFPYYPAQITVVAA